MFAPPCAGATGAAQRLLLCFAFFFRVFRGNFLKSFFHEIHEMDQKEIKTKKRQEKLWFKD